MSCRASSFIVTVMFRCGLMNTAENLSCRLFLIHADYTKLLELFDIIRSMDTGGGSVHTSVFSALWIKFCIKDAIGLEENCSFR